MARLGAKGRGKTGNGGMAVEEELQAPPAPEIADDYIEKNRAAWERWARESVAQGRKAWNDRELCWGLWNMPESDLGLVEGLAPNSDALELGCGTASISAWLARRGMRPVAVDFSRRQLENA
jgi:2-polyprenyl-3-methyl-5-hydroxy-6-metoxy-1,4-benzoquinol methylase